MDKQPLLVVDNLVKHFPVKGGFLGRQVGRVHAVDGVSLVLRKGQTLGLVGESGCGKSTLGRTVLRLYEPTAGRIQFDGTDITRLPMGKLRAMRRDMQIIFQDPFSSLNPRMSVGSIIAEPFIIHKVGRRSEIEARVKRLLGVVGLSADAAERFPHEFSGGQRQRIGIARALALEPKMIVADEPVSALDVSVQSQILNLLVDLRKQFGLSYLFIAHDLAVIEHISDFVAVMYLGRIVEYAASETLYAKPSHPYTRALISSIPIPRFDEERRKNTKEVLQGDVPNPINPPLGCHFHPRCPLATDICRKDTPPLRDIGSQGAPHMVACHHV